MLVQIKEIYSNARDSSCLHLVSLSSATDVIKRVLFKGKKFIAVGLIFISVFFYLHQKVIIFIEAYQLNKNYDLYKGLVDKRDYLMYNFSKETSLAKVNEWAKSNNFSLVKKERLVALNLNEKEIPNKENKFVFLFNRLLRIPADFSQALAEVRK